MNTRPHYDVIILGGGLAGLTLSLQLKQQRPETSILVLEKREGSAPGAAHKVGESTVELGTHYIREVLGLKDYMEAHQLPKHGLRFFFSPKHKDNMERRVELGPRKLLPVPSHQIDRGVLENDLIGMSRQLGNDVLLGAKVEDVALGDGEEHTVTWAVGDVKCSAKATWVSDATGRGSFMKRKLDFREGHEHAANAVWFRVNSVVDIHDWGTDPAWLGRVEPGLRYLSTVHFMDKGYWLWIIPLVTGCTSIGIVADPAFHPFDTINRFDRAMAWIERNEPQVYRHLLPHTEGEGLLDFMVLKHYAHGSGQVYSDNRWAVTGEAGYFLDPLYSPGTDFISMNNTWLTDLITRDLGGEDIGLRVKVYEETHRAIFHNWMPIYTHQYALMGHTQVMVAKIFWDWAIYWAMSALIFTNKGFTDIGLLKRIASRPGTILQKFGELNLRMQGLLREWMPHDTADFTDRYIDPFDVGYLRKLHEGIEAHLDSKQLFDQLTDNMALLEKVAAELFRLVSHQVNGTPQDMPVDPYTMSLGGKELSSTNSTLIPYDPVLAEDVAVMWFYGREMAEAV